MGALNPKLNNLASRALKSVGMFDSFLLARRQRLVKRIQQEMDGKTFEYHGMHLPYTYHTYNSTYANERCVEVSIGKWFLETHEDVLEVGNVMNHYCDIPHEVVDKYEIAPGVRNEDVVSIKDHHKNILAISTLEHVGFDDGGQGKGDHTQFFKAVENIKSIGQHALITLPWGVNPSVDKFVSEFTGAMTLYYRDGREWKQGTLTDIREKTYGSKYSGANAIAVVEL